MSALAGAGGAFAGAQRGRDVLDAALFEIAQDDRLAVFGAQAVEGLVQRRFDIGPGLVDVLLLHGRSQLGRVVLVMQATAGRAPGACGRVAGGAEEPTGQAARAGELVGTLGQQPEDRLADILCQVCIGQLAAGRGVDHGQVTPDQFGKGRLGLGLRVLPQELIVVIHANAPRAASTM